MVETEKCGAEDCGYEGDILSPEGLCGVCQQGLDDNRKSEGEQPSCKVLKIRDKCEHKECKWQEEPCVDCKYNPSRYFKTEPIDRYEEVSGDSSHD